METTIPSKVDVHTLKFCHKCLRWLPATTEYFRLNKKKGTLWSPCKECVATRHKLNMEDPEFRQRKEEYDREWIRTHRPRINAYYHQRYVEDPEYRASRKADWVKYRATGNYPEQRRRYETTSPVCIYGRYRKSAKTRGFAFELTYENFMIFWQQPCFYCGGSIRTIGLDRVNSQKGYRLDNLVSCCVTCNRMKMDHTQEDFLAHVKLIYKKHLVSQ